MQLNAGQTGHIASRNGFANQFRIGRHGKFNDIMLA
jgi:hypothetical protein